MKAVIQRVEKADVSVDEEIIGSIGEGILVFLGIGRDDKKEDAAYLVDKIINLRIFEDNKGKMNLSALKEKKEILVVSQFTLYGDCSKGRRPNFFKAAPPKKAQKLYEFFIKEINKSGLKIATGQFKAMMTVELINDGPVTLLIDSNK